MAPRAGFGIYDAEDGRCLRLAGEGLTRAVPIASVFKLWVLDAVAREVQAGDLSWSTTVVIRDALRSDPSGEAYGYPTGRRVPVSQLARLMISISDNTAADHLIELVGRDAVGRVIGELAPDGARRTLPLLTTADMARLKFVRPELGQQYLDLDPGRRLGFLRTLPMRAPLPWLDDAAAIDRFDVTTPRYVDQLEWYASGPDLCRTMADLARLAGRRGLRPVDEILSANPGLPPAEAGKWRTHWFKGGSEPGVVSLAYRLATGDRDRVVVVALSDPDAPLVPHADGERTIAKILAAARD